MSSECESITSNSLQIDDNVLTLNFMFTVDAMERQNIVKIEIERVMDHVSFSLPYNLNLTISDANLILKEPKDKNFIYVFKFDHLNYAIEWMKNKTVNVELRSSNGNAKEIEAKMARLMNNYEKTEFSNKKRKKLIDEDGFTYYV